ncbi:MAG TPA: radical SAM protein [Spirochaetota bacterium]|nr:radical SAM protein [Spirochaetota bacterium]
MKKNYLIIDCFVDEPACFGVPPFIAPYPRYVYGALVHAGADPAAITYITVDRLRGDGYRVTEKPDHVLLIGGAVVPGKYLGAKIGTVDEVQKIIACNRHLPFVLGGMIRFMLPPAENVTLLEHDIEAYAHGLHRGRPEDRASTVAEVAAWSVLGAPVVKQHPDHPVLVCEMETYRGCPRKAHCSFCSEGLVPFAGFRRVSDITAEVDALAGQGISRFRLGRQADILQYGTSFSGYRGGFPRPEPAAVGELFSELKTKKESGTITLLNIDNANPGTIVNFPEESAEILSRIAGAVTPGDTLALGIESVDEKVIAANSLKVTAPGALEAVRIINETCGARVEGIPVLLPGINLVHGLRGEEMKTFEKNYRWLASVLEQGLLVRRINIRRALPFPGTALHAHPQAIPEKTRLRFEYYRDRIRHDIDIPMLKKIYPAGTVLRDVRVLDRREGYSLGKQVASYSITVKIAGELAMKSFNEAVITGHQERSLTGLTLPVDVNGLSRAGLESIPGIGKKRAADIILARPFTGPEKARAALAGVDEGILKHIVAR